MIEIFRSGSTEKNSNSKLKFRVVRDTVFGSFAISTRHVKLPSMHDLVGRNQFSEDSLSFFIGCLPSPSL